MNVPPFHAIFLRIATMRIFLLLVVFVGTLSANESEQKLDRIPVRVLGETPEQSRLRKDCRKRLQKPIDVHFERTSLEQVVADISKKTGIPIRCDQESLEVYGIGLETSITFRAERQPANVVLHFVCAPLSLADVLTSEGVIIVNRWDAEDLDLHCDVRLYDVSAILAHRPRLSSGSDSLLPHSPRIWLNPADHLPAVDVHDPLILRLLSLVRVCTRSDWDPLEYDRGSMTAVENTLIVRHSPSVHKKVHELLEGLAVMLEGKVSTKRVFNGSDAEHREQLLESHLDEMVTLHANDEVWIDVIRRLSNDRRFPIVIDQSTLEEDGTLLDERVTLSVVNVTRREAFRKLLQQVDSALVNRFGLPVITSDWATRRGGEPAVLLLSTRSLSPEFASRVPDLIKRLVWQQDSFRDFPAGERFVKRLGNDLLIVGCPVAELSGVRRLFEMLQTIAPRTAENDRTDDAAEPEPIVMRRYVFFCDAAAKRLMSELPKRVDPERWTEDEVGIQHDPFLLRIRQTERVHLMIRNHLIQSERLKRTPCTNNPQVGPNYRNSLGGGEDFPPLNLVP